MGSNMNNATDAIKLLQDRGIPVEEKAYGFCLTHAGDDYAQCGIDNDSSTSISIDLGQPPVQWFFRVSFLEMAEFIAVAYQATQAETPTKEDILQSMQGLDKRYDAAALDAMTAKFLHEGEGDS